MEKIIDYVNETPYNTNIGILKDKLRKYSNELMSGAVKTVNGILPDDTGNVEIEIPEGFSGKWDDLEGKPFYYEETTVWNIEDLAFPYESYGGDGIVSAGNVTEGITPLVIGEKYEVIYDEVSYVLICGQSGYSSPMLGTYSGYEVGDEYPFYIEYTDGAYNVHVLGEVGDTHNFTIKHLKLKQLDPKFLPESSGVNLVRFYYNEEAREYVYKDSSLSEILSLDDLIFASETALITVSNIDGTNIIYPTGIVTEGEYGKISYLGYATVNGETNISINDFYTAEYEL